VAVEERAMILRALILGLIASLLAGCPYDRVHPPYLQNKMTVPVDVEIVLLEGVVSAGVLEPGGRLGFGYRPDSIAKVTFSVAEKVIDEIDALRIALMLKCTADPRLVTWLIEADGLRPSIPCS